MLYEVITHRIFQIEPGELDLLGMAGDGDIVQGPVVERPVILEFQGAEGVGDALQCVL